MKRDFIISRRTASISKYPLFFKKELSMEGKDLEELVELVSKKILEKKKKEEELSLPLIKRFVWKDAPPDSSQNDKFFKGLAFPMKTISSENLAQIHIFPSREGAFLAITSFPGNTVLTIKQWKEVLVFFSEALKDAIILEEKLKKENIIPLATCKEDYIS